MIKRYTVIQRLLAIFKIYLDFEFWLFVQIQDWYKKDGASVFSPKRNTSLLYFLSEGGGLLFVTFFNTFFGYISFVYIQSQPKKVKKKRVTIESYYISL